MLLEVEAEASDSEEGHNETDGEADGQHSQALHCGRTQIGEYRYILQTGEYGYILQTGEHRYILQTGE